MILRETFVGPNAVAMQGHNEAPSRWGQSCKDLKVNISTLKCIWEYLCDDRPPEVAQEQNDDLQVKTQDLRI